jgi:hypothetical protein
MASLLLRRSAGPARLLPPPRPAPSPPATTPLCKTLAIPFTPIYLDPSFISEPSDGSPRLTCVRACHLLQVRSAKDSGELGPEHRAEEEGVRGGAVRQVPQDAHTTIKTLCSIGCKVIFYIGQPSRYYS